MLGRIWQFLMCNDRTTVSKLCFLIYYSEPFSLGKVKITNAMVLADRNVVTVARRRGG